MLAHAADNAFPKWPEFLEIGRGRRLGRTRRELGPEGPLARRQDGPRRDDAGECDASGETRLPGRVACAGASHHEGPPGRVAAGERRNLRPVARSGEEPAGAGHGLGREGQGRNGRARADVHDDPVRKGTRVPQHARPCRAERGAARTVFSSVGYIVSIQRGTEWAATGTVTQKVPADFPTAAAHLASKAVNTAGLRGHVPADRSSPLPTGRRAAQCSGAWHGTRGRVCSVARLVVGIRSHRFGSGNGPRWTVRCEGVRSRRPALAKRHGRLPGRNRCVHRRRRRDGAGAARRVQRRDHPAQGQRHAARRSGRDAVPDPGQYPVPARPARDGVRGERGEHQRDRSRYSFDGLAQYKFVAMRGIDGGSRRRSKSPAPPAWTCGATIASASRPTCSS